MPDRYATASLTFLLLCAAATGLLSCARTDDHLVVDWTILNGGRDESLVGKQLKMRIPRGYVLYVYRDRTGEAESLRGVKNNGIEIVSLKMPVAELAPAGRGGARERTDPLQVDISADVVRIRDGNLELRELLMSQAKRGMVYKLPDAHGLERFRRMGCKPGSAFDVRRYDRPLDAPPSGCWELGDESWVGRDGETGFWITCNKAESLCAMRTSFRKYWPIVILFPRSYLAGWKSLRTSVEKWIGTFVTDRT